MGPDLSMLEYSKPQMRVARRDEQFVSAFGDTARQVTAGKQFQKIFETQKPHLFKLKPQHIPIGSKTDGSTTAGPQNHQGIMTIHLES